MRNLLPKLRRIQEELSGITIEVFAKACLNTSTFYYEGEDVSQMIKDGEQVGLQEVTLDTGETVYSVDYDNIYICTEDSFNEIVENCAREYRFKYINDFLEPFFDDSAYYKACKSDKGLMQLILEYDDIKVWEYTIVDNNKYVIFK